VESGILVKLGSNPPKPKPNPPNQNLDAEQISLSLAFAYLLVLGPIRICLAAADIPPPPGARQSLAGHWVLAGRCPPAPRQAQGRWAEATHLATGGGARSGVGGGGGGLERGGRSGGRFVLGSGSPH
jgi:hypothetical protein